MSSPLFALLPTASAEKLRHDAAAASLTPEAYLDRITAEASGLTFGQVLANVIADIQAEAATT